MKRKIKKVWFLSVLLLLACGMLVYANEEKSEFPFAGERSIVYTADLSEISNYFNGGRTALDMYVRATKPDWLSYQTDVNGTDFSVTCSFEFESFEEYEKRMEELVGCELVILYLPDDVSYLESIEAWRLLGFLKTGFEEDVLNEYQLKELFDRVSGELTLNGQTYEYENQLAIYPEKSPVRMASLEVYTQVSDQFLYNRTIQIGLEEENSEEAIAAWKKQLQDSESVVASSEKNGESVQEINFQAHSIEELAEKTMRVLAVADFIRWEESYGDRKTTECDFTEKIDVSGLNISEDVEFCYEITFPDNCGNILLVETDGISCSEHTILSKNINEEVSFSFQKPVTFSSVQIQMDLSDIFGKEKKQIQYRIPLSIAQDYHEDVRENLEDTLVKGQILEIYDEASCRVYEIRCESWYTDQLEEMGNAQLQQETLTWKKAFCPFAKSSFTDRWIGHQITFPQITDNVTYELIFPPSTFQKRIRAEAEELENNKFQLQCSSQGLVSAAYRDASPRVWLVSGFLLMAAGIVCVLAVFRIRKYIQNMSEKKKYKKIMAGSQSFCYCSKCGCRNPAAARFCDKCGQRLK